jgi:hypothetical protein
MQIIAFILDPPVIERILTHVGEPVTPPAVLAAISPATDLKQDVRGGTISRNDARSGTLGGGTMRLKCLSPGFTFLNACHRIIMKAFVKSPSTRLHQGDTGAHTYRRTIGFRCGPPK